MNSSEDTIVAIATPIGEGGISVIRLSGTNAVAIAERCFRGASRLGAARSHTAHFGSIVDSDGMMLDEGVLTVFRAPHSYTREDVVEVSCHGGVYVTRRVLELFLRSGCRHAAPGEFTKRAFLNGRIDLSQAEAVADLIRSRSEMSRRVSIIQLQGKIADKVKALREKLINLCSLIELELDFVEEGLEFADASRVRVEIEDTIRFITLMVDSYSVGKIYREGVRVVLTGKPNVGKSSILNSLLNENRAIVTDIPGTTRDTIEENIIIEGVLFTLIDTAGMREDPDLIEGEGIARAQQQIENADITLLVLSAEDGFLQEDEGIFDREIDHHIKHGANCILVMNKTDRVQGRIDQTLPPKVAKLQCVATSAKTGEGLDILRQALYASAVRESSGYAESSLVITNVRHQECLRSAIRHLSDARDSVVGGKSNEFIALDVRQAIDSLGEIIGEVTSDEILNSIFSKFCIGK